MIMIDNIITVAYMLGILGIMIVVNTMLGITIANKTQKFNKKKLLKGISKAVIIVICTLLFCLTLELVPVVLRRVDINIPTDLITVLEIVLTTLTAYKKYALDCFDKFKKILKVEEEV